MIQCISRLAQGLSISLLELNTFAHALCALLIYGLWWEKPLDVEEPTFVHDSDEHALWANACFLSRFGAIPADSFYLEALHNSEATRDTLSARDILQSDGGKNTLRRLDKDQQIAGFRAVETYRKEGRKRWWSRYPDDWQYLPCDVRRLVLIDSNGWPSQDFRYYFRDFRHYGYYGFRLLCDRQRNWPSGLDFDDAVLSEDFTTELFAALVAFTLAGFSYGAIHLLAWNAPFTSPMQRQLWQISAISVAASGPALLGFKLWLVGCERLIRYLHMRKREMWLSSPALGYGIAYSLLYLFARTYLVVECFISLAYLPDVVFQQPQWTYYFPHIT